MDEQRALNALYGLALGDALGTPWEFSLSIPRSEVRKVLRAKSPLSVGDDTQMSLFTLEGLAWSNSLSDILPQVKAALFRWYDTQLWPRPVGHPGLGELELMHKIRAPDGQVLGALGNIKYGSRIDNEHLGSSVLGRSLPFALLPVPVMSAGYAAIDCAHLTHKPRELDRTICQFMIAHACAVDRVPLCSPEAKSIDMLGGGWEAQSCLNMALWAFCRAKDFNDLMVLSICHEGKSDTVAAVAGGLWGIAGREIPHKLIDRLVENPAIEYAVERFIRQWS